MGGKAVPPPADIFPVWLKEDEIIAINAANLITRGSLQSIIIKISSAQAAKKIGSGRE